MCRSETELDAEPGRETSRMRTREEELVDSGQDSKGQDLDVDSGRTGRSRGIGEGSEVESVASSVRTRSVVSATSSSDPGGCRHSC